MLHFPNVVRASGERRVSRKTLIWRIGLPGNICGAPEGNNLEPFSVPKLLEELENWSEVLKSEPEVIHRLAAFAEAAEDDLNGGTDGATTAPSFEEPSP